MHLFSLNDFGAQFGIDLTVPDFNDAVSEASKAATRKVVSSFRLGGLDAFTSRRDVFQVRRMFDAGSAQNRDFRLSRAFIDAGDNFSAQYTANPVHVRNNETDMLTNLQDVNEDGESDYLFIDAERGILTVFNLDLTDQWVVVTYDGGLDTNTDQEYLNVPDWLSDAARAQTALLLRENRAFTVEGATEFQTLERQIADLWSQHARLAGAMVLPTMTEDTAT